MKSKTTKLHRIGGTNLYVVFPVRIIKAMGWRKGTPVTFDIKGKGVLVVRKGKEKGENGS